MSSPVDASAQAQAGGVAITGVVGSVAGDIVGGHKIGLSEEKLVEVLESRGLLQGAKLVGLQQHTISG